MRIAELGHGAQRETYAIIASRDGARTGLAKLMVCSSASSLSLAYGQTGIARIRPRRFPRNDVPRLAD